MQTGDSPPTNRVEMMHAEVDNAESDLNDAQRTVKRFLDLRHAETPSVAQTYLRGVYVGLQFSLNRIDRITQYSPREPGVAVDDISDETARDLLNVVVTEAVNENWGNVRVNMEKALEQVAELEDESAVERAREMAVRLHEQTDKSLEAIADEVTAETDLDKKISASRVEVWVNGEEPPAESAADADGEGDA